MKCKIKIYNLLKIYYVYSVVVSLLIIFNIEQLTVINIIMDYLKAHILFILVGMCFIEFIDFGGNLK